MSADYVLRLQDIVNCSQQEKNKLIYECQTNLFWLANNVLRSYRSKPLLQSVHGGICNSLVHKFPSPSAVELLGSTYDPPEVREFEHWSSVKERVILSSRGTLKSTIEAADIVQLILCEPNIRILILSGRLGLAKTILRMARGYFESNEILGYLFPQWTQLLEINAEEFTTPARHGVNYRDPTVQIGTFGSVKAGVHVEYLALDDCTNEINQATPELVEKSIESYDDLDPLLEPGGYKTFTGTRWATDDLPEYIRQHGDDLEKNTGHQHVIYFSQPIWTLKTESNPDLPPEENLRILTARNEREKNHQLKPDDVNLLWPDKLNAEFLWPQYIKNYRKFACQYLLNPESALSGVFTRKLLNRQTRPISECPLPHRSATVINWDLAGISGKGDFACGVVGIWEETGRLYIVDAVIDKFRSSTDICNAIVRLYKKWNPDFHRIESANGSELISGELRTIANCADLDRAFYPGWDPPSNKADAKYSRIMLLAGALERDELQFFSGIPCLDELFQQFEKFGKKVKNKKANDDGPDCVAQLYEKWKGAINPKSITYLTPSETVIDFQSQLPKSEKNIDVHADEKLYADIDFLKSFTVPFPGRE